MKRVRVEVVQLGESKFHSVWKYIKKIKNKSNSKVFEIVDIKKIALPNSDYFWSYSDSSLLTLVNQNSSNVDISLCFIDYPLEDNYFFRRLHENVGVATFHQTSDILIDANLDLRNFILLFFYIASSLFLLNVKVDETINYFHDETRGCLFDMCGLKRDIIVSASKPILCYECEAKLRHALLPEDYINNLKREIKRIKKPLYYRIFDWVKGHPILSIIITALFAIIINLLSSLIFEALKSWL